ncbi:MAG TPA: hypothetical protein PLZ43_13265 [bacterium]|nr:hypothetical protein [bacterium]
MLKGKAFWIKPDGGIIHVRTSHINEIICNPEMFGTTEQEIDLSYAKYKEKKGVEGDARKEHIIKAVNKGFIRIRHYVRECYWSINVLSMDEKTKSHLRKWALTIIESETGANDRVVLNMGDSENRKCFIKDLLNIKN